MDNAVTIDQLKESNIICDTLIKISKLEAESNVGQIENLPTFQSHANNQEEELPKESSDEDVLHLSEPILNPDEGVDITPVAHLSPDQLMKTDEGVHLNPKLTDDVEVEQPSDDSNHNENGIFPFKFIFKDIVMGGDDVQKTAAAKIPATKSPFSIRETAGPPYYDTAEPSHRAVKKSFYTSEIHPKILTKPLKKAKFKLMKDKLLAYSIN